MTLKLNICSVRVPSLPIWCRHLNLIQSAVILCCVILTKHGTVPYSLFSIISAAWRRAVLQANKWRSGNEESASRNEERTRKKPSCAPKNILKRRTLKPRMFITCNNVFPSLFYLILMILFFFLSWSTFWYCTCAKGAKEANYYHRFFPPRRGRTFQTVRATEVLRVPNNCRTKITGHEYKGMCICAENVHLRAHFFSR